MSFYIGFVTKNLVTLAADRKYMQECTKGYYYFMAGKLRQINKNTWGVHIGDKDFGEKWLYFSSLLKPKCLVNTYGGLRFISHCMHASYVHYRERLEKLKIKSGGFTNIAIAGFKKDKPFIYAMDSSRKFVPVFCPAGVMYNCIERNEGKADLYIQMVTRALREIQKESKDQQKAFLRTQIPKMFKYLSEKHDCISSSGDLVFITPEASAKESF